jgi:hypothetical protein
MEVTQAGVAARSGNRSKTKMPDNRDRLRRANSRAQADSAAVAPPCAMVIFGAAGDLTKRLIVPALYNLVNAKRLSRDSSSSASTGPPRPWRNGARTSPIG